MSQYFLYPPIFGSFSSTNPANGTNGLPIPTVSTQVGGENPSGNLEPLQVDAAGNLLVTVGSSVLPTGGATAANQVLEIAQLTLIEGHVASIDSNTIHVDTNNVTVVSSVLPTGASTSALQISGNASLSSIDSKLNTLGQKTMSASVPVAIASDQSAIPVTVGSLPLPTGAATAALQTAGNSSLSDLDARTAGSLVPVAFNEIDLTYVASGNGTGQISTAVYKLATVTIATLTMAYDSSNRLSSVVKS